MSNETKQLALVNFGNKLKGTRERYSLSRKQLAERAQISPRTLAAIENGRRKPSESMVKALELVFGFRLFMNQHREVIVRVGTEEAGIDELIAPLIEQLWIAGVRTSMSCQQDYMGCIWLRFPGSHNLQKFFNLTVKDDGRTDQLFERMCPSITFISMRSESWQEIVVGNPKEEALCWNYELDIEFYMYGKELDFSAVDIDVRFPQQDLPIIFRRIKQFNRAHNRDRNRVATGQGGVSSDARPCPETRGIRNAHGLVGEDVSVTTAGGDRSTPISSEPRGSDGRTMEQTEK